MIRFFTVVLLVLFTGVVSAAELRIVSIRTLRGELEEMAHFFEAKNPEHKVNLTFAKSNEIAKMLKKGLNGDIFVLNQEDLPKGSPTAFPLVSNEPAVITAQQTEVVLTDLKDLATDKVEKIIMLNDTRPFSNKIRMHLEKHNLMSAVQGKFQEAADPKTAFQQVAAGPKIVGFAYAGDAVTFPGVKVLKKIQVPEIPPIIIVAGINPKTQQKALADSFMESLRSTIAKKLFENGGYTPLMSSVTK